MSEPGSGGEPVATAAPEARRIARGALWATLEVWGVELLQLLAFLLLARLVGPEAYGLVALAMAFVLVPQNLLVHGGWIEALVQRPELSRAEVDSVFWLLAGLGLVSTCLLLASAPLVSSWFGLPELGPLLAALSVCPLLTSLMVVPAGLLQRRLALAPLALRSILGAGVGGAVAVALALAGAGPWALVANEIAWPLAGAVVLGLAAGHRPQPAFALRQVRAIGCFALGITGEQLVTLGELFLPRLLLAAAAGPIAVGLWGLARKLFELSAELVTRPALRVALPGFARLAHEPRRLSEGLATAVELTALLAVPGYLVGVVLAPDLVATAFGEPWREAGEALRLLALSGPILPLGLLLTSAFQAAGRADLVLALGVAGGLVLLALLLPLLGWGAYGVAAAFSLRGWLLLPARLLLARRILGIAIGSVLRPLLPILLAGAAMVAAALLVRGVLDEPASLASVGLAAGCAIVTYLLALPLVARPALRRAALGLRAARGGVDRRTARLKESGWGHHL
ncbi:MAG: lipopolysaccharide biosynthesis protein [Geminicoccaceae bacterium]|jgi:PST family polysaccharide transporter|nr:MAG: lipopolysaccharide biosynthesis protein [Geminicoccaceae bacterium]